METLQLLDERLFRFINQTASASWLDSFMILLSSKWIWFPAYLFIVYKFLQKFGRRIWVPVLLTLVTFGLSDSISTRVLKNGVQRERPFLKMELHARLPDGPAGSKFGFVSSHAANMFALATMLVLLMQWPAKYNWIPFALAGLVAYSRVYLGVHYPFDVLGGAVLGCLLSIALYFLFRKSLTSNIP